MPIYRILNQGGFEEYFGISLKQLKESAAKATAGGEGKTSIETVVADNALPTRPGEGNVVVALRGGQIVGSYLMGSGLPMGINSWTRYSRLTD